MADKFMSSNHGDDPADSSRAAPTSNEPHRQADQQASSATTPVLLDAVALSKQFGGVKAVQQASLQVEQGSITGLIGPNGAGKTTLFNLLCNFIIPNEGTVNFDGEWIHTRPPYEIAQLGMVRTFQVARVLSKLSVLDNLLLGAQRPLGENFWNVWLQPTRVHQEEKQLRDRAIVILESIGLAHMAHDYAGALSGGQRKLLEMARALMVQPKLVLLDEPAAGVNPTLIQQICDYIRIWNEQGTTFLIIEHNMDVVMTLCDRVWVLAEGTNLAVGPPQEIQANPQVLDVYLGIHQ